MSSTVYVYTWLPASGVRRLALGDAFPDAPDCEWCANRRAVLEVDDAPFCKECLGELLKRGRRA